jgi:hypothetical protein
MTKTILLAVILCLVICATLIASVLYMTCKYCPLKKKCDKALHSGEKPPCHQNDHDNPFIGNQFTC